MKYYTSCYPVLFFLLLLLSVNGSIQITTSTHATMCAAWLNNGYGFPNKLPYGKFSSELNINTTCPCITYGGRMNVNFIFYTLFFISIKMEIGEMIHG